MGSTLSATQQHTVMREMKFFMYKKKNITKKRREIFLDVLRTTGNVSASARAANISSRAFHTLKANDAEFEEEWVLAKEESLDELEAALRQRAIDGVEKPVYYGGKECGTQRSYSDSVGMYILKTHRGESAAMSPEDDSHGKPIREVSARDILIEKLDAMARNIETKMQEQCDDSK